MTAFLLAAALAQPAPPPTEAELQSNLREWMRRTPAEVRAEREMFAGGAKMRGER